MIKSFLLIGQSNMAGFGLLHEVSPIHHPRIFMHRNGQWIPAEEPLHQEHARDGVGLGMRFAEVVAQKWETETIGLVPSAVSGTSIRRWQPGADLYQRALRRARIALESSTLAGILWLQGEADSGTKADALGHYALFEEMVIAFREDLNAPYVPFIAGALGEYLQQFSGCRYFQIINTAYRKSNLPHFGFVESSGLTHLGDKVHFNSASLRILGDRFATSYLEMVGV